MRKYKILVLIAALAFSFGSSSVFAREMGGKGMTQQKQMKPSPEEMIEKQVKMLTEKFNLTVEQQAKAREILTASTEEIKKIMQESREKIKEIREKDRQEIGALLTEEQKNAAEEERQVSNDRMPPMRQGMPE